MILRTGSSEGLDLRVTLGPCGVRRRRSTIALLDNCERFRALDRNGCLKAKATTVVSLARFYRLALQRS